MLTLSRMLSWVLLPTRGRSRLQQEDEAKASAYNEDQRSFAPIRGVHVSGMGSQKMRPDQPTGDARWPTGPLVYTLYRTCPYADPPSTPQG